MEPGCIGPSSVKWVYVRMCVRSVCVSSHREVQATGGGGAGEEEVIWVSWCSPGGPFLSSSSLELSCDDSLATLIWLDLAC